MSNPPLAFDEAPVDLKDRDLAALLAWLVPGLGHFYQGRRFKACLFFVLIVGTFVWGLYLGGDSEVGWGRVVYASWRKDDHRWHYFCQLGVGLPAFPALVQAYRGADRPDILWHGLMAPPRLVEDPEVRDDPSLHLRHPTESTLNYHLNRFFELGTVYTMLAGLMNILAIYDAWGGPVWLVARRKDEAQDSKKDDTP
jgi:hypothetical protein